MKELGDYLKRTRISNGVSLDEASSDLELSVTQLENIEAGNTKAFKDIYELREHIKNYAKYLGISVDVVNDSFNEYLFEKTSKISLEDIKEAEKKIEEKEEELNEKKIHSPYTKPHKEKINLWPILVWLGVIIIVVSITLIIIKNVDKEQKRNTELLGSMEEFYEFTY